MNPITAVWDWMDTTFADRLAKAVAALALALSMFVGFKHYALSNCLADYSDRVAQVTAARVTVADEDRKAEDAMWQAFADAGDPAKVPPAQARQYARDAFNAFIAERKRLKEDRAANPYPVPPSQSC